MLKKILSKSVFVLVLVLFFQIIFCGQVDRPKDILVIGISGDVDSLNPLLTHSRFGNDVSQMLFLNLMQEESDFKSFKPELATSWDVHKDGKKITFHLRTDAFWSDGLRITAEDIQFTYKLQTDKSIGWVGASVKDKIQKVQVVNDSTVQFVFEKAYPDQLMDINDGVILPKHILEKMSVDEIKTLRFNEFTTFSGAYKLKSWVTNQYIELVRNEKYYVPEKPVINQIVFKIVPDKIQLFKQLYTGEVDVVDGVSFKDVEKAGSNSQVKFEHFPFMQYVQVAWNLRNPLFADKNIRKALTLAIDRQTMVDHLLAGYGSVCHSPIHSMLWAYKSDYDVYSFDPEKAKTLLAQSGWKDSDNDGILEKGNMEFEFTLLTGLGSQTREDAQVMIQEMLKNVGIKVMIQKLEWSVFLEKLMARDFDSILMGMMTATKVDLFPVWHSSMVGDNGFNLCCYENPSVDKIIEKARSTLDYSQALELWTDFQKIIMQDQPATFLWVPDRLVGLNERVKGYDFAPSSTYYNLADWYIE